MPATPSSLLPPNATRLERALEAGGARVVNVDAPVDALWDPWTCPADVLPWFAWSLSVDRWEPDWPELVKRQAVADSIAMHRIKGTRASVEAVLASFDELLELVEWHEASPRREPHTFEITLPIAGDEIAGGDPRATAAFADAIVREVSRVKPLREHFTLAQRLAIAGDVGVQAAARAFGEARRDMALTVDTTEPWAALLQTEDGEPLQSDNAQFLDTTP